MNLTTPIDIDLLAFFKTGTFDFIKLGKTKDWIIANFPDPDSFSNKEDMMKADIWYYGNIEFHFNNNKLFSIFSESIDDLDGGNSLRLNKWILSHPEKLTLLGVIGELNNQHINFTTRTDNLGSETIIRILLCDSNVELSFMDREDAGETNPNRYQLSAFSFMER